MIGVTALFLISLLALAIWALRLRESIAKGRYSFRAPIWKRKSYADAFIWVALVPFFTAATLLLTAISGFAVIYFLLGH